MKYRIKIYTYKNGRKEFEPQVKIGFRWKSLSFNGKAISWPNLENSRQHALDCIDKHYAGNTELQTIEFEYIDK